jgi:uncharacterized protein YlxW (UPF0749 family)
VPISAIFSRGKMSRSNKRSIKSHDTLKKENEELRTLNKALHRELKKLNKEVNPTPKKENIVKEEQNTNTAPKNQICEECNKGKLEHIDLGIRKIIKCDLCDFRKVIKNGQKS